MLNYTLNVTDCCYARIRSQQYVHCNFAVKTKFNVGMQEFWDIMWMYNYRYGDNISVVAG